ncbi:hypothetical protein GH714_018885 [Hevea brasiliensis]|uniref:Uncharacterized protein n=1 Tax=Hevea brasiliensis TaxID=3981 RepID=A0A6A6LQ18_HEVBR|nr:hypothetical protein GH714_018885 [Hevea brasiliensis]
MGEWPISHARTRSTASACQTHGLHLSLQVQLGQATRQWNLESIVNQATLLPQRKPGLENSGCRSEELVPWLEHNRAAPAASATVTMDAMVPCSNRPDDRSAQVMDSVPGLANDVADGNATATPDVNVGSNEYGLGCRNGNGRHGHELNCSSQYSGISPVLHPSAFMPMASWDGSGARLQSASTAVMPDPLSAFLACQSQPMTMDAYSRMAAIYQQLQQQPPASSSKS